MHATGAMSRMKLKLRFVVERRVDCVRRDDHQERVAVRRRFHDDLGADIAAGARSVLDDELLAEPLRQPLTDRRAMMSGAPPAGKPTIDAHRSRRIGLRPRDARHGRQRGSACGQMQEFRRGSFIAAHNSLATIIRSPRRHAVAETKARRCRLPSRSSD